MTFFGPLQEKAFGTTPQLDYEKLKLWVEQQFILSLQSQIKALEDRVTALEALHP